VRRCAGGGAAQRALFTQSPPTPSARGVGGAASAVPQRQGVAAALWGSLAAGASWQPSAARLVREASAGPPECSPAPGFRPCTLASYEVWASAPLCRGPAERSGRSMAPAHGVMRGPISRTPAQSQGRQLCTTSMLISGIAAASERHRTAAQVRSCARGGSASAAIAGLRAATCCSLDAACLECCEASTGSPSRGDPAPDIPYLSRITLIACPKKWAKKAEFTAAARLSGHTLT